MKIKIAQYAGFCFGVNKAIVKITDKLSKLKKITVYGKLIHNPQVNHLLSKKGLSVINNIDDIKNKNIAIRTHGIPYSEFNKIKNNAASYINLTCSKVAYIQGLVKKYSDNHFNILIVGHPSHPEVKSIASYAKNKHFIISKLSDLNKIPASKKYLLVSQTTSSMDLFKAIKNKIINKKLNVEIINTICDATHNNQNELKNELNNNYDKVIVIGGRNSSNTKKLVDIAKTKKCETIHIETAKEIDEDIFNTNDNILISAGASTPDYIILNCLFKLKKINSFLSSRISYFINKTFNIVKKLYLFTFISIFFIINLFQKFTISETNLSISLFSVFTIILLQFSNLLIQYVSEQIYDEDLLNFVKSYINPIKIIIFLLIISNSILLYNINSRLIFYPLLMINLFAFIYNINISYFKKKKINYDLLILGVISILFLAIVISLNSWDIKYILFVFFFLLYFFFFFLIKSKLNFQAEKIYLIKNFLFSDKLKLFFLKLSLYTNIIILSLLIIFTEKYSYAVFYSNLILFYISLKMVKKENLNYYNKILNLLNINFILPIIFYFFLI